MIFKFFIVKEVKKFTFFFILLFVTLFLGNFGLTGITLFSGQIKDRLNQNAKELLTSDITVSARRDLNANEQKVLDGFFIDKKHLRYKVIDLYSMVTHLRSGQGRLVEIRSTEPGFPFYGSIKLKEGGYQQSGFYISKDLADLWDIRKGEALKVGDSTLEIEGIVESDSSLGLRGFSLAPRVYLPLEKTLQTGLLKLGSTGGFAQHFKLQNLPKETIDSFKPELQKLMTDPGVKVTLPEDSSEQTGRVIHSLSQFMSLAALIGLVLSLVGVFYLYQSHLVARLKDLCLLNLFGLSKSHIAFGILGQFSFVFLAAFLAQSLLLLPLYKILVPILSTQVGIELSPDISVMSTLKLLPFLYGLSLAILIPLIMGLMRTSMGQQLKAQKLSLGKFRFWDFVPFCLFLWGFSHYLSRAPLTANLFFFSLLLIFGLSTFLVKTLQWVLSRLMGQSLLRPQLEMGIAMRSLVRSGHKLTLSFLSIAMGSTLISLILQLDVKIQKEFILDDQKPGLFIFDIQEEQIEDVLSFAKNNGTPLAGVTPMIRARLDAINGEPFKRKASLFSASGDDDQRFRGSGLNLTYRGELGPAEKMVEGEPFPKEITDPNRPAFVSLEKRYSERMGVGIGDKLLFDIQGVELEGVIRNIREVKWTSFYPNFFVNIEPGFIEAAPKTFLAVLPASPRTVKQDFQRKAVSQYANISFIDVEELVGKLGNLFEKSRQAVEIISWLSLSVGLVILYGLSHDQVYRRYYDLALMKTLGLSPTRLRLNLLYEFGLLFVCALSFGFFLGWLLAQILGQEIFKTAWSMDWPRLIIPASVLVVLCLATILFSSWRAVRSKPRELLSDG